MGAQVQRLVYQAVYQESGEQRSVTAKTASDGNARAPSYPATVLIFKSQILAHLSLAFL